MADRSEKIRDYLKDVELGRLVAPNLETRTVAELELLLNSGPVLELIGRMIKENQLGAIRKMWQRYIPTDTTDISDRILMAEERGIDKAFYTVEVLGKLARAEFKRREAERKRKGI